MLTMIEHRKEDVWKRREIKRRERAEWETAVNEFNEWENLKATKMQEAKDDFEAKADEEMA